MGPSHYLAGLAGVGDVHRIADRLQFHVSTRHAAQCIHRLRCGTKRRTGGRLLDYR